MNKEGATAITREERVTYWQGIIEEHRNSDVKRGGLLKWSAIEEVNKIKHFVNPFPLRKHLT